MISDAFFMLKVFVMTLVVTLVLQVRVGDQKLETGIQEWVATSYLVDHLQGVVDGGAQFARSAYGKINQGTLTILNRLGSQVDRTKERGMEVLKIERHKSVQNENEDTPRDSQEEMETESPEGSQEI